MRWLVEMKGLPSLRPPFPEEHDDNSQSTPRFVSLSASKVFQDTQEGAAIISHLTMADFPGIKSNFLAFDLFDTWGGTIG